MNQFEMQAQSSFNESAVVNALKQECFLMRNEYHTAMTTVNHEMSQVEAKSRWLHNEGQVVEASVSQIRARGGQQMDLDQDVAAQIEALRTVLRGEIHEIGNHIQAQAQHVDESRREWRECMDEVKSLSSSVSKLAEEMKSGYKYLRSEQHSLQDDIQQLQDQITASLLDQDEEAGEAEKEDDADEVDQFSALKESAPGVEIFRMDAPKVAFQKSSSEDSFEDVGRGRPQANSQAGQKTTERPTKSAENRTLAGVSSASSTSHSKVKEAEVVRIPSLPTVPQFRSWKLSVRDEIAGASGRPDAGFAWIMEVEKSKNGIDDLHDSGHFPSLDAKLAASLSKALTGELARQINIVKEQKASEGLFLKGRHTTASLRPKGPFWISATSWKSNCAATIFVDS